MSCNFLIRSWKESLKIDGHCFPKCCGLVYEFYCSHTILTEFGRYKWFFCIRGPNTVMTGSIVTSLDAFMLMIIFMLWKRLTCSKKILISIDIDSWNSVSNDCIVVSINENM